MENLYRHITVEVTKRSMLSSRQIIVTLCTLWELCNMSKMYFQQKEFIFASFCPSVGCQCSNKVIRWNDLFQLDIFDSISPRLYHNPQNRSSLLLALFKKSSSPN